MNEKEKKGENWKEDGEEEEEENDREEGGGSRSRNRNRWMRRRSVQN